MRYLLLFALLIGASVTLPFVTMPERLSGQPVAPEVVANLPEGVVPAAEQPVPPLSTAVPELAAASAPESAPPTVPADLLPAAPVTANLPAEMPAALVTANLPADMPVAAPPLDMPAPAFGALTLSPASLFPFDALAEFFTPDGDAAPAAASPPAMPAAAEAAPEPDAPGDAPATLTAANAAPAPETPARSDAIPVTVANRTPFDPISGDTAAIDLALTGPTADAVPLSPIDDTVGALSLDRADDPVVFTTRVTPPAEPATAATEIIAEATPAVEATAPGADAGELVEVTANALNMRAGPSSAHPVVIGLARGARAQRLEDPLNGWVHIRLEDSDTTGWVFGAYLEEAGGV